MRRPSSQGFTLLEVLVAMAILGMALMAIFDLNAGAVVSHGYTKRLTVATLLARSKMTDIEQELIDDGFPLDDKELQGDFSDEGWDNYKWRAKVIAPKTSGVSPEKFMGALFNLPMGEGGSSSDDPLGALAKMMGGGGTQGSSGSQGSSGPLPPGASATGLGGMAGMASGMMQQQFNQMLHQIAQTVREVHLTVSWKDGKLTESVDLVTHVVSLGKGSDRNAQGNTLPGTPGGTGNPGNTGTGLPPSLSPFGPGGVLNNSGMLRPGGLGVPQGRPLQ